MALAGATLYLPTRRACRLARDRFLDVTRTSAAILPRIVPIGDPDEDEIAFAQAASPAAVTLDLPPALDALERRLLLAQLVLKWTARITPDARGEAPLIADTPAAALALADDLARLMDDMATRAVSWDRLDELVPDNLDRYWALTLDFLKIAREQWPNLLAAHGAMEQAARRDALIAAEAERLAAKTDGPVIVAGSTGSMPATAALIATVSKLDHGAVVLPGLDTDLDPESWELIAGARDSDGRETAPPEIGHPQFALQTLLQRIGITRDDVRRLGTNGAREHYVSEALRPAGATYRWHHLRTPAFDTEVERALKDVAVIEAPNSEEEALAIAIALRETAEAAGKTAALVTPDRALARRVLAALARWNVAVDDSGGDLLSDTPAGRFARLAAEAALRGLEPVTLLALLKHPSLRLGAAADAHAHAIATLERAVLRGPRPRPKSAGLADALVDFRTELGKFRRKERSRSASIRSAHCAQRRRVAGGGRLRGEAHGSARSAREPERRRAHVAMWLWRITRRWSSQLVSEGTATPPFSTSADGKALTGNVRRHRRAQTGRWPALRARRLSRPLPRPQRPHGAAAGRA